MSETDTTIRVLIADDHPVTRRGIHADLEKAPGIQVVGEAADGEEAKKLVAELDPHILLLDLVMPGPRPSEVEAWVRKHSPETITLVLTAHDRDDYLVEMLDAGVAGYLNKKETGERLIQAIHCAARGDVLITGGQLARASRWREKVGKRWESLTGRERQILRLLAKGAGNAIIAGRLSIQARTVEYHVTNILKKLGVVSRLEAAMWARDYLPDDMYRDP